MQDTELFELCKSVYEATGWDGDEYTLRHYLGGEIYDRKLFESDLDDDKKTRESYAPLYTSDYLLEKLPKYIEYGNRRLTLMPTNSGLRWDASYDDITVADDSEMDCFAETPLKALLKLTLELHKKGLLDAKDS